MVKYLCVDGFVVDVWCFGLRFVIWLLFAILFCLFMLLTDLCEWLVYVFVLFICCFESVCLFIACFVCFCYGSLVLLLFVDLCVCLVCLAIIVSSFCLVWSLGFRWFVLIMLVYLLYVLFVGFCVWYGTVGFCLVIMFSFVLVVRCGYCCCWDFCEACFDGC